MPLTNQEFKRMPKRFPCPHAFDKDTSGERDFYSMPTERAAMRLNKVPSQVFSVK